MDVRYYNTSRRIDSGLRPSLDVPPQTNSLHVVENDFEDQLEGGVFQQRQQTQRQGHHRRVCVPSPLRYSFHVVENGFEVQVKKA